MILINLFSVFDPTSYFGIRINWIAIIIIYLLVFSRYYLVYRGYIVFFKSIMNTISNVFKEVASEKYLGIILVRIIGFIYLIICNLIGLFPFIFTGTAHIIFTIGLGVVMWISFFLIGWTKNLKIRLAHLVPEGRPLILSPILVLIELISHLIRPFTLSIRLAANIIAGHLIVGLLSRIRLLNLIGFFSSLIFQRLLLILEFGVAIIQGFVFRILLLLYAIEYY